ncbi:ABC transporter substrate-binding protein [Kordiimonas sp.]|uniref:ABC transporter substrate-binding protein n=1 Tax=Kordiimonas sp. TaxID=1970157 RepID=UPI003A90F592
MRRLTFFLLISFVFSVPGRAEDQAVVFATDWKAQAEHGGFYQAVAKGFYKKRGLDVRIRPGGPQTDNPRLMAAGALDIAMASNSFQPLNLIGAGARIKVVMASFQKDPQVLMVHPHVDAASIGDLRGRSVFISDSAVATFWPWLEAKFGFQGSQIRKYTYSLAPWLVNKNTVQEGYLSSEPYTAMQAGVTPKVFLFADAGYPGYASMVMVRDDYLTSHRSVVKAFVAASIEGWQDYVWGDPGPGNSLILRDNSEMTPDLIAFAIGKMRDNAMLGNKNNVGQMEDARWASFYEEMSALGIIERGLDVKNAYTLEFLPSEAKN